VPAASVDFPTLNHRRLVLDQVPGSDSTTQVILFGRQFSERLKHAAPTENVRLVSPAERFIV
jgi:hypothetical protein